MKRVRLKEKGEPSESAPPDEPEERSADGGSYWSDDPARFFSSGCVLLDCALGGGWALARIVNVIGDKSTGKTQLAIEACANFARTQDGPIIYIETEAAFDPRYAEAVGLPRERVSFPNEDHSIETVEHLFEQLQTIVKESTKPPLVIVDSLDALSDRAEMERDVNKGTYGQNKAKFMSELFRRLNQRVAAAGACVMIVSQVRDKTDASWGKKETRAGGRALDFYASQFAWLYPRGKIEREKKGVKRIVGVDVLAKIEKNKVGTPFREVMLPIFFSFGVDDVVAGAEWLEAVKRLDQLTDKKDAAGYVRSVAKLGDAEYNAERARLGEVVRKVWAEVEADFAPTRRKYT